MPRCVLLLTAAALAAVVAAGCGSSAAPPKRYHYVDTDSADGKTDPSKESTGKPVSGAERAKLEQTEAAAQKRLQEDPGDGVAEEALSKAATKVGDAYMYAADLDKTKYGVALKHYRIALKADPFNRYAKDAADTIVAIYKQLGKPVPGE